MSIFQHQAGFKTHCVLFLRLGTQAKGTNEGARYQEEEEGRQRKTRGGGDCAKEKIKRRGRVDKKTGS